jgi:flagellar biosynthesis GTPase FlhF
VTGVQTCALPICRFGILYDVIKKAGKPVTYLTCGQNVPQDIEEVTPSGIANLIMRSVVN